MTEDEFEDTLAGLRPEQAIATPVPPGEARAHLALSEQIDEDCPEMLAALQDGDISLRHGEQVVKAGSGLDAGADRASRRDQPARVPRGASDGTDCRGRGRGARVTATSRQQLVPQ